MMILPAFGGRFAISAAVCLFAMGATSVLSTPASADVILQGQITSDHCSNGGCLSGLSSAGTVTIDVQSGTVDTVTVNLNSGFEFIHSPGFALSAGFDLGQLSGGINPTVTYSSISSFEAVVNPTSPGGNVQAFGSYMEDGFGTFNYGLVCSACGSGGSNPQPGPLNFTIAGLNTSVGVGGFVAGGSMGADIVFDVIGPNHNTGLVDVSNFSVVPGPIVGTGLPGLIAACGGLVLLGRRRRQIA